MDNIHMILEQLENSAFPCVLATIVHVEGSAYRRQGTVMLIQSDGTRTGVLSAGCLESDVAAWAQNLLSGSTSAMVVYDLSSEDDLSWGRGAGCNGAVHVLMEPVDAAMKEQLLRLKRELDQGKQVTLFKCLGTPEACHFLFVNEDGDAFGNWPGAVTEHLLDMSLASRPISSGIRHVEGIDSRLYIQRFAPKPRLIIFGAGIDAEPLSRFAAHTGFEVVVSDWRAALLSADRFPDAARFWHGVPHEALAPVQLSPSDSVIVMTHDFQTDRELLTLLREKRPGYLGVLGSRKRTERLLGQSCMPEWIRSPVGIPIAAEGPEEIAISIIADVIKSLRERLTYNSGG